MLFVISDFAPQSYKKKANALSFQGKCSCKQSVMAKIYAFW